MRDVTNIPDALLDVIARAIKIHMAGLVSPLESRVRHLEDAPAPVVPTVPTMPVVPAVIDYTADIEAARRVGDELARQLQEARTIIGDLRERLAKLEAREMPTPRDGEDGRDAYALDVLPAIDFTRSYQRGTVAQHQGGLWRAYANTEGAHGWSCVVDGIHDVSVTRDGERGFAIRVARASDTVSTTSFVMPVVIYRGVYQPGHQYEEGDSVTWAGSLWHCNKSTDSKPDTDGGAWTLAAKRGRDGRDLRIVGDAA